MKKYLIVFTLVMVLIAINIAFAEVTVYGNKVNGDILFNNIEWGSSRDTVFSFLKDRYPDIEIEEEMKVFLVSRR